MVCHGLGRDDGFRRARRSLCLLREGELVVHEAPQADAYCYERRHRAAYAAWSSLALPHWSLDGCHCSLREARRRRMVERLINDPCCVQSFDGGVFLGKPRK